MHKTIVLKKKLAILGNVQQTSILSLSQFLSKKKKNEYIYIFEKLLTLSIILLTIGLELELKLS